MKKLIVIFLFLSAWYSDLPAQSIQYKNTSIHITNDGGFGTISNQIRYQISCDLDDSYLLDSLFEGKKFELQGNKLVYGDLVDVPNMWQIIKMIKFEQEDVGKYIIDGIVMWSTNMMYDMDLLKLKNYSDWAVKE